MEIYLDACQVILRVLSPIQWIPLEGFKPSVGYIEGIEVTWMFGVYRRGFSYLSCRFNEDSSSQSRYQHGFSHVHDITKISSLP